jgi:hypothetical protein
VSTSVALAETSTSPSYWSFSLATAAGTSLEITVVLFHAGSVSVVETTTLGMLFIFLPNSPVASSIAGHAAAKPSYVTRPSSCTSLASSSSNLNS